MHLTSFNYKLSVIIIYIFPLLFHYYSFSIINGYWRAAKLIADPLTDFFTQLLVGCFNSDALQVLN